MVEALGQVLEEGDRVVCLENVADRIPASRIVLYRRFLFGQETEVVSHSLVVSLGVLEQIQAQVADRKRVGIVPP